MWYTWFVEWENGKWYDFGTELQKLTRKSFRVISLLTTRLTIPRELTNRLSRPPFRPAQRQAHPGIGGTSYFIRSTLFMSSQWSSCDGVEDSNQNITSIYYNYLINIYIYYHQLLWQDQARLFRLRTSHRHTTPSLAVCPHPHVLARKSGLQTTSCKTAKLSFFAREDIAESLFPPPTHTIQTRGDCGSQLNSYQEQAPQYKHVLW